MYRHSVYVAREDLGFDGTDEDRLVRYGHRISENRQRLASIRSALDPTLQLAVDLPDHQPLSGQPVASGAGASDETSQWLVSQLGARPEERIARERWEREAQRLTGLQGGRLQPRPPAQPATPSPPPPTRPSGPAVPRQSPPKPGGPTTGR